jgi:hypothetical protein
MTSDGAAVAERYDPGVISVPGISRSERRTSDCRPETEHGNDLYGPLFTLPPVG